MEGQPGQNPEVRPKLQNYYFIFENIASLLLVRFIQQFIIKNFQGAQMKDFVTFSRFITNAPDS